MKLIISGILVGIVVVVVVVVWRLQSVEPRPTISGETGILMLAVLADDVMVREPGDTDFKKINKEARAGEGAEIKTNNTGRASILYHNGTITNLSADTYIVVKNQNDDGRQSKLRLSVGSIWSKLKNILGKGDFYEIETENMVASVRGTEFRVEFKNGISVIEVFENKVSVQAIDPKNSQPIAGGFIELFAGEKTTIDSKNLPSLDKPLKKTKFNFSASPLVSVSPSATPTLTPKPVLTNSPQATPTPTPSPTPIPTPVPSPTITSVAPSKLKRSETGNVEFAINGRYLNGAKTVFLGEFSLQFFVVDSFTIFAQVGPNTQPGIYDVGVVAANGEKLTLYRALEVQ